MIAGYADMARASAPLLIVAAPMLGAALAFAVGQRWASWVIATLAALCAAGLALDRAAAGTGGGVGVFACAVVTSAGALVILGAGALMREFEVRATPAAHALALATMAGWSGALLARDFVVFFLAVETAWLAGVGLTALSAARQRGALNGALRMLSAGGAGAALMLLGLGMAARGVGGFEFAAIARASLPAPNFAAAGAALVIIALALKAAIAPLHSWSSAAFGRGGAFATLMLGAVGVIGALAAILRVSDFAVAAPAIGDGVTPVLAALGVLGIAIGSLQAMGAQNVQRLVSYALSVQGGCILITLALGSPAAFAAALVQLLAACASALALIAGAAATGGPRSLSALDGLARRAPLAGAAIAVGALGLLGAPLTLGFLGRWRLIEAAVGVGWWWAAGAAIAASLAGVFYAGRLIERVFFRRAAETQAPPQGWLRFALAPALAAAIAINLMGLDPGVLLAAAQAAASLTGVAQ